MYIDNENFDKWMERLSKKLSEIGQDLKSLINTDKILDNQDLAFLLKVSFRTLQRYRASGKLPYFMISHKTYYRAADIRVFIQENADCKTYERFKKENQLDKQTEANQGG
ncbi:MAG: helix-turn-helix domain-containing protein [Bacteroides thetaiotaomicron]